jgi:hypothetical protein
MLVSEKGEPVLAALDDYNASSTSLTKSPGSSTAMMTVIATREWEGI